MIKDENLFTINEIFLNSGKYCFNKCFNMKWDKMEEFKKCQIQCNTFQNKKFEYIENYLYQINNRIEGDLAQKIVKQEIKQNHVDKYILPEHFYRSSELESTEEIKQSVGSIFGRNR